MNDRPQSFRKILHLTFPPECSGNPVMSQLVRKYDLTFSIMAGQITPRKEGSLTVHIEGSEDNWKQAKSYLDSHGITVASVAQHISRDENSCMHCGLCTAMCPADALVNEIVTRSVSFFPEKCTACGICARVCPVGAMQVDLENMLM